MKYQKKLNGHVVMAGLESASAHKDHFSGLLECTCIQTKEIYAGGTGARIECHGV
jgi:hypothetical protein